MPEAVCAYRDALEPLSTCRIPQPVEQAVKPVGRE